MTGKRNISYQYLFGSKVDALDIAQQTQFINELDSTVKEIQTVAPDAIVLASGIVFFASDAATKSREDIGLISAGSMVGITILIIVVFRSFRPLFLSIISVLFGIGMAFIFSHFVFRSDTCVDGSVRIKSDRRSGRLLVTLFLYNHEVRFYKIITGTLSRSIFLAWLQA